MKFKVHIIFSLLLTLGSVNAFAQIGIGTKTPAPSAALEVTSSTNNKGILIPRITATQKDAIVSPAEGLLVYQTTAPIGFYYYSNTVWKLIVDQTELDKKLASAKTYVDDKIAAATIADANATTKGKIQLAGDLGGTAAAPTVPALALKANTSDVTTGLASKANTSDLATVATSGSYNDLVNKPNIPSAYVIPKASASELGGVKVGANLSIDANGVLSAAASNSITGVVPVANGGTGQTTVPGILSALGFASNNVAIGSDAGTPNQGGNANTIAIGGGAGRGNQGQSSIAIGYVSGDQNQGANSISIGGNAAQGNQGTQAVAIGFAAGQNGQGANSVAIGTFAGQSGQAANSIAINATGTNTPLNPTTTGFFVDPIINRTATSTALYYNTTTKEITSGTAASPSSPTFTGAVTAPIYASTPQALIDASTIIWDPALGLNASVTLGGNRTLSFSTTPVAGAYGTLVITQDGTGSRTITLPSTTNKVLGSTSTTSIALSTAANTKDILNFYYDGTNCYWNIGQGYGSASSSSSTVNLASGVTGTLPVANGGTGATTLTGLVKGSGTSALTAAVAGTDYQAPLTLTTTGTGAATLSGTTLNIPTASTISIGTIGTSNANGANITSGVISLAPADGTNGGIVTTGAQTLAGIKSFSSSIAVGTAGAPVSSAALEVSSTVKGFLPPRMTQAQREAIDSPAQGLMIYCTNCGANGEPEYYNGTSWVNLSGNATVAAPVEIGSAYQGGILAYYLLPGDPGYDATTPHGLIAATTDQGYIEWWNGSYVNVVGTSKAIGTGLSNTNAIISAQGTSVSYAARLARNYAGGGYNDWYLPSQNELNKILQNIGPGAASPNTNIFGYNGNYYTSSQFTTNHAWEQYTVYGDKSDKQFVRAVRSF